MSRGKRHRKAAALAKRRRRALRVIDRVIELTQNRWFGMAPLIELWERAGEDKEGGHG
jgi:hypothetical protein